MERLEGEIRRELERLDLPASAADLAESWPGAVGELIAANAWPARVARDGTLVVHARDSIWAFELTQRAGEILDRLDAGSIKGLKFVPGPLPEGGPGPLPEPPTPRPRPGPAEERAAAALVASIEDTNLREIVSKAAILSLSQAGNGRSFW